MRNWGNGKMLKNGNNILNKININHKNLLLNH